MAFVVYCLVSRGRIVYVGQTSNPTVRLAAHRKARRLKGGSTQLKLLRVSEWPTRAQALAEEGRLLVQCRELGLPVMNRDESDRWVRRRTYRTTRKRRRPKQVPTFDITDYN